MVEFTACTAARIGETSGVRRADINRHTWIWHVRRQTTPGPGGLIDKGTKGKRARLVPIIEEIRPLVDRRLDVIGDDPMARLFTGRAAAGSPRQCCATQPTGTTWGPNSATATCAVMTYGTPA